jgi:hypothetical protein
VRDIGLGFKKSRPEARLWPVWPLACVISHSPQLLICVLRVQLPVVLELRAALLLATSTSIKDTRDIR